MSTEDASTRATAQPPKPAPVIRAPKHDGLLAGDRGDQIELLAGDLVQVAQAEVRVVHQPAGEAEVFLLQGRGQLQGPLVLGHHVARPLEIDRVEAALRSLELGDADVAQRADARVLAGQLGDDPLARGTAVVVGAARELAPRTGVHHHDGRARGHRHGFRLERAAVEQQRLAGLAGRRDELVHDPAVHPDVSGSRPSGRASPSSPGPSRRPRPWRARAPSPARARPRTRARRRGARRRRPRSRGRCVASPSEANAQATPAT